MCIRVQLSACANQSGSKHSDVYSLHACIFAIARLSSMRHDHTAIRLIIWHIRLQTVYTHTAV